GKGPDALGHHLAEVGPHLAAVGGAEEAVVVVGEIAAPAPGQHDVRGDGYEAAPALGGGARRPRLAPVGRAREGAVHDADGDGGGEESDGGGTAGLDEGEGGAAVGRPVDPPVGDAEA